MFSNSKKLKDRLARTLTNYELKPITLLTTRPPRQGEVNGREYYFISQNQMDDLDRNNKLVERRDYETIAGIWSYATGANEFNLEQFSYLVAGTWVMYQKYLNYFGPEVLVPCYFELDDGTRLERALRREKETETRNYLEMCRRYLADAQDFTQEKIDLYHPFPIDNNGIEENTMEQIENILV